ncbi:MAG: NYN domain-containing protein [Acidobacteria bacterium]|nr:MAG: NYN domain-containing protein [Acidobacteriota bacterium]
MLLGAVRDWYDRALLISRDSDLAPAVRMVVGQFPLKQVRCFQILPGSGFAGASGLSLDALRLRRNQSGNQPTLRQENLECANCDRNVTHDPGGAVEVVWHRRQEAGTVQWHLRLQAGPFPRKGAPSLHRQNSERASQQCSPVRL